MITLLTVVGNTDPTEAIILKRDGIIIDLTSATGVDMIIKNAETLVVVNSGHQACTINAPATSGSISYEPVSTDFATAGRYLGSVKITRPSGVETLVEEVVFIARD